MNKAFFINGGSGRVLCSMPALERYAETDDNFVIVAESWGELYLCNKKLRDKVYFPMNKDLFENQLKDRKIISPEPYRVNQYFNQKCNLIQAFDIEINGLDDVRETGKLNLDLSKEEQITGYNLVDEVRQTLQKEKVIVLQPFGQSSKMEGRFIYDTTGRSFEVTNVQQLIEELRDDYGIILMSEIEIPGWQEQGIAHPKGVDLNKWIGVINAADYFLGCDSVGQHMANSVGKPATVVIGSTYPENISYPDNKNFTIIDNGDGRRRYSPIRLTHDIYTDRNNEDLMVLDSSKVKEIVKSIKDKIGVSKKVTDSKSSTAIPPKKLSPSNSSSVCNDVKGGSYPKKILSTPKSTVKYNGFQKPKSDKKKPIDKLLDIEAKKV